MSDQRKDFIRHGPILVTYRRDWESFLQQMASASLYHVIKFSLVVYYLLCLHRNLLLLLPAFHKQRVKLQEFLIKYNIA